jgi:hypothetical protein
LRNLTDAVFLSENFSERTLPGKGNAHTKLVSFQHAIELVMVLPGKVAKETRTQFANIITRYMAGDETMIKEIKANAESQSVINQFARASLPQVEDKRKRKALELEEKEEALEVSRMERRMKTIQAQKELMDMYAMVSPNNQLDDRTRLHFKDIIINLSSAAAGNYKAITNGEEKHAPITISTIAAELGLHLTTAELQSIGVKLSKLYTAKYGVAPPKHEQQCGGAVRMVRSYTERDRAMVEDVLKNFKRQA